MFYFIKTLNILKHGAKIRSTGATNMNLQSSRSHAIFTLNIKQKYLIKNSTTTNTSNEEPNDYQTLTAKFHFVDLAGSERLKRTGATGSRAKEGICINRGLLALGNVISALGDREKLGCHVPYRDSKLTRLLQDSLGGNSRTLMIACVSPSDRDFMETLNTLRYANRTRNIKNKVFVNQDKTSLQIAQLKAEIERLNYELLQYKSKSNPNNHISMSRTASTATIVNAVSNTLPITNSPTTTTNTVNETNGEESPVEFIFMINKLRQENIMLLSENQNLRQRSKALQETLEQTKIRNCDLEYCNQNLLSGVLISEHDQNTRCLDSKSLEIKLKEYIKEIEDLKCKLTESEIQYKLLKQQQQTKSNNSTMICSTESLTEKNLTDACCLDDELMLSNTSEKKAEPYDLNGSSINLGLNEEPDLLLIINDDDNKNQEKLQNEINTLGFEIDLKKRLIDELETNNKNLEKMKIYYEDKLNLLHSRIKQIQEERDKMISQLNETSPSNYDDQIKKIRLDYELKLQSLQSDLHKYQQIKSKNNEMLKQAQENERNLSVMNRELFEMKKLKVKLMNQLKDDSQRFKKEEQNRMREIATLKRDHLKKDSQIKFLEAEKRCKEIVLKRKQEQLQALRRNNTTRLSDKASGKFIQNSQNNLSTNKQQPINTNNMHVPNKNNSTDLTNIFKKKGLFSRSFQLKWQKLDQIINGLIVKKQTISLIERDMERFLEQREKISRKLNKLINRLNKKSELKGELEEEEGGGGEDEEESQTRLNELKDRIDVMKSNIDYLQDQIGECQTNIIHLDELKDGNDYINLENFIETITSVNESKYFLKKLLVLGLNKGITAAQKEYLCNELKCELEQYERDYNTQQQLLQNIINSNKKANSSNSNNNNNDQDDKDRQFMNSFNNYFNNQLNGKDPNEPNVYNEDNFDIDEIILAPKFDDSTTESESDSEQQQQQQQDDSIFIRNFKHTNQKLQEMNEIPANHHHQNLLFNDNSVKARQQLIHNGPQDLLYCSKTNLDKTVSNSKTNLKSSNSKLDAFTTQITNLATQVSRICSKSYTKIPEILNPNDTKIPLNNTLINTSNNTNTKSSTTNLNNINIPMSKSVIVTSSDNSNYKRMTRSSMSRQNSK